MGLRGGNGLAAAPPRTPSPPVPKGLDAEDVVKEKVGEGIEAPPVEDASNPAAEEEGGEKNPSRGSPVGVGGGLGVDRGENAGET